MGAGAPVEVTQKMLTAGVYAAREHALGESLEELVRKVYLAMALEVQDGGSFSASEISSVK